MTPRCSFVVAGSPSQFTGGYLYDARIADGLQALGWEVHTHGLEGRFPLPDDRARGAFHDCLAAQPDGACVIVDGLVLGGLPEIARAHASRLDLVALVHHPLAEETGLDPQVRETLRAAEREALAHARRVVVTSRFTGELLRHYGVEPTRVRVVEPGTAPAPLAPADQHPPRLLCVASIVPRKGHLLLVEALHALRDLPWSCTLVGSTGRDAAHARRVAEAIASAGLSERIRLAGEMSPGELEPHWMAADLFVLPSLFEGFGMVVTEAVAHGLPVLATRGGALADTLPADAGVLVAPGDAGALAATLHSLLRNPAERARLRAGARRAREQLRDWTQAAREFADALVAVSP